MRSTPASRPAVPQFLRRRQSFRQTTAAQQVSPVSGGRIKVARYLRLGDVEVSEEEDAGKHDEAKAQAMGGDWSTGTTMPPAQANRGGAPRGSPAAANQAGAPRAGQAVNPGGAPPRARPGRPWWQKGGTLLWKDRAPLDLGVGVLYDLDRRKLEPHARVRVGDFVCGERRGLLLLLRRATRWPCQACPFYPPRSQRVARAIPEHRGQLARPRHPGGGIQDLASVALPPVLVPPRAPRVSAVRVVAGHLNDASNAPLSLPLLGSSLCLSVVQLSIPLVCGISQDTLSPSWVLAASPWSPRLACTSR